MQPRSFTFVSADDFGILRASDRKSIRSYCMRGKNKKNRRRLLISEPHLAVFTSEPGTYTQPLPISHRDPAPSHSFPSCEPLRWDIWMVGDKAGNARKAREVAEKESVILAPPPEGLSFIKLAGEVDRHSRELLFKFFNSVEEFAYPIESCVDFDVSRSIWSRWLEIDTAYLHSVLLGTSVINDFFMNRPPARATYFHLRKTIANLNEHLSDSAVYLWDSTVAVVVILAMLADVFGDYGAVRAHIAGLQQIIRLRGGLESFRENTKLHIKIRILDLYLSLQTGEQPHLFTSPVSWIPMFDSQPPFLAGRREDYPYRVPSIDCVQDRRLIIIFRDFQFFVGLMNTAASSNRLRDTDFQNFTFSIQYRLLQLQGVLDNVLDECLRLTMLAFLTIMFPLPGRPARYPYLASRFRECCCSVDAATPALQDLMLWFLIVGAISIYGVDVPWLRERWQTVVPRMAWREARQRLQDIMWIDTIHDKTGRQAFEAMTWGEEVDSYTN